MMIRGNANLAPHAPSPGGIPAGSGRLSGRAFTLVELAVVLGIVVVLVAILVPAANNLLEDRKYADAQTRVSNLLKSARANALKAEGVESGLFFYLTDSGEQRMVTITRDTQAEEGDDDPSGLALQDVFRITGRDTYALPAPIRAVPRYAVDEPTSGGSDPMAFSDEELARDRFEQPIVGTNQAQRHRNFFALVYATDGQLVVGRDVLLIRDKDTDGDVAGRCRGDVTGLVVACEKDPARNYYDRDDSEEPLGVPGSDSKVSYLIVDPDAEQVAVNFLSVDGLLVYDDSVFRQFSLPELKRQYLLDDGRPFYVSRFTGEIVQGPRGEVN